MIINDLDGYYIVFDTKNWNTELDTLINNSNIISRIGRVNSTHIYIVHWVLIEILFRIGNDVSPYLYFLSPLIIFFVSYVLSETYLKILVNRFPTKCKK